MTTRDIYIAIDIGAGTGVKIGLFTDPHHPIDQSLLHIDEAGGDFETFAAQILNAVEQLLHANDADLAKARSIGIASPGLFNADGSFTLAANLPFLNQRNLKQWIADQTQLPTAIENDANVGGLAEWSVLRVNLLYWVFGGGWGGAWINPHGQVMFPTLDWDGNDASLHYTNEPGYAIPLSKHALKPLFYQFGASFDRFEQIVIEDLQPEQGQLLGPGDNPDTIRAEVILSGPGRCRLFRAVVGDDDFYERFLDIRQTRKMADPSIAGKYISQLSEMRVESALNTDRLFGHILAVATHTLTKAARADGLPDGLPICLGGKPSYALPYFGPTAQRRMGALGVMNYMRPSVIDERGFNANLVGAAVLAEQTYAAATTA